MRHRRLASSALSGISMLAMTGFAVPTIVCAQSTLGSSNVAAPLSAITSQDPTAEVIIVTATRSGSALQDLPISVSVVSETALISQLRRNTNIIAGLELAVPGLSIQSSETRGSCGSSLRGRSAAFQINGVPVGEELRQGSCTGPFTLSPFAVERVEVVRGGTALYGSGAPGGIINLVTRRAKTDALEVDVTAQTGANTSETKDTFTTDLYVGAGQRFDAWDYYVGLALTDGGNARDATGAPVYSTAYQAVDLNAALGLDLGDGGNARLLATWHREAPDTIFYPDGSNDPVTGLSRIIEVTPHPQSGQAKDQNLTLSASYTHPAIFGHAVSLSAFVQDQSLKQRDNFFDVTSGGDDFFASNRENARLGFRSALVRDFDVGAGNIKASYGFDWTSNRFLRFTVDAADNERIIGYISPEIILRTAALYGQLEGRFGRWAFSGGVRQEYYSGEVTDTGLNTALPRAAKPGDFGDSDLLLANIGAVFDLGERVQLYGGFSQGAELSQLGRAARGIREPSTLTPAPATSDQLELGVRGRQNIGKYGSVEYGAAIYQSRSDSASLVQPDPSCAGVSPFCPLIPLRAPQRFSGFEANARWQATDDLALSGVLTLQRGKIFDDDLGRFISYSTDVIVPLRITVGADWQPNEQIGLALQINHYGASSYFTPTEQGLGFVDTKAQTLLSGTASYKALGGEFYIAADNLLNADYVLPSNASSGRGGFSYYRAPGRRLTIGFSARY